MPHLETLEATRPNAPFVAAVFTGHNILDNNLRLYFQSDLSSFFTNALTVLYISQFNIGGGILGAGLSCLDPGADCTPKGATNFMSGAASLAVTAPEPASVAILSAGLAGLGWAQRRSGRRACGLLRR
jgi:hypothetical protein